MKPEMCRSQQLVDLGVPERELDLLVCIRCGAQQPCSDPLLTTPPNACSVCLDPREAVRTGGQEWTTIRKINDELDSQDVEFRKDMEVEGITSLLARPHFAIGQRAILFEEVDGLYYWDCQAVITPEAVTYLRGISEARGLKFKGIFLSHPHFQTTSISWAKALDCKVFGSAVDRGWYQRRTDPTAKHLYQFFEEDELCFRSEETGEKIFSVFKTGGHFPGSCVGLSYSKAALATGDTIYVTPKLICTFMWSYVNMIPLNVQEVKQIHRVVSPLPFDIVLTAGRELRLRQTLNDGSEKLLSAKEIFDLSVTSFIARIQGIEDYTKGTAHI